MCICDQKTQSPIQLLLPPGLCMLVCPTFTRDAPSSLLAATSLADSPLFFWAKGGLSIASTSGLGGCGGNVKGDPSDFCGENFLAVGRSVGEPGRARASTDK